MYDKDMMNKKPIFLFFPVFSLLVFSTAFARADVSLRNGNFYVSFRDISYVGGMDPKIERVYNSKSEFSGMFGYGWGTEYETKLQSDPDGSIVVTEFGGGADNRFVSKNFKAGDIENGIKNIIDAAKKSGSISSVKQIDEYKTRLNQDYEFRSKQYELLVRKGLLQKQAVPEGAQFTSTKYFYQYITKVKGGYVRVMDGGVIQKFNDSGKLVQILDRNKNFINFTYDANGRMVQMIDHQNRKMNLTYNQQGLVEKIAGESGKFAAYKYSKDGLLIQARDDGGVENSYAYSADLYKNLTEIGYLNNPDAKGKPKKMQIAYYGPDKNVSVKSVINPDGTVNEYVYDKDPKKPGYYSVKVSLKDSTGARITDSRYEYYSKTRTGGDSFTARMVSTVDGEVVDTTYDEKLGYPIKIVNDNKVTTMEYDTKGRMIKKVTPIETTELSYDTAIGKVTKVVRTMKSGNKVSSEFSYDQETGNLVFAKNNENKSVKLVYDSQGRIRALVDQTGRQLALKYNEISKPVEISDGKLGVVKFTYKNSGEVDKIESNGGNNVAMEVMRILQSLIDITAPAGVTMSL